MSCTNERIESVLSDPSSSGWLKTALLSALDRDPLDALRDAETLRDTLKATFLRVSGLLPR
jgi:hypothetical protein